MFLYTYHVSFNSSITFYYATVTHLLPILGHLGCFRFFTNAVIILLCYYLSSSFELFPRKVLLGKKIQTFMFLAIYYWTVLCYRILKENILFHQDPVKGIRQSWVDSLMKTALCPSICLGLSQGHMSLPESDLWCKYAFSRIRSYTGWSDSPFPGEVSLIKLTFSLCSHKISRFFK